MTGPEGQPGDGYILGVDLGTSHTVAMLRWPDGRTRPVLFDGQPLLPSAVYRDTTGRLHVGRDAQRLGHADPGRLEPNPKRHVDVESVLLGDASVPVADLLAALLAAVARETVAATGFLPPAVLTYPAGWGSIRRAVLTNALGKAGWPAETRLVPEPVAAARYFADVLRRPVPVGSALAVFDFGGGTLDIAVVRNVGLGPGGHPHFEVAASGGADDLGGFDLDAALVDHLGKALAGAEPEAWAALSDPATLAQWRARRQFWEDVRGAKEMLSRSTLAPVPVPGVERAVHLTRDELEAAVGPLIRRGVAEAATVIKAAGLTPHELAGLFLVGGSSRVPLVARLIHGELGLAPTVLEQPELPVAEGAIVAAASAPSPEPDPAAAAVSGVSTGDMTATVPGQAPASPAPASPAPASPGVASLAPVGSVPGAAVAGGAGAGVPAARSPAAAVAPLAADGVTQTAADVRLTPPAEVRYQRGHAAAATRTSTADTVPHNPPPPAEIAAGDPEPEYVQPVDPWANAEEAAFGGRPIYPGSGAPIGHALHAAEPWLASAQPESPAPGASGGGGRTKAYQKKLVWILAAVLVVVVGVGATFAVVFWPGYPALEYRSLAASEPVTLSPAVPVTSSFADTAIVGDRAYFASVSDDGLLGVVAAEVDTGKEIWKSTDAGSAPRWEQMIALPSGVALFTAADSTTGKLRMVILGAENGHLLWQRTIGDDDGVLFIGDVAVLVDRVEHRLLGLEINGAGKVRWEERDIKTVSGTTPSVFAATTPADFAGAASVSGTAFAPDLDDDQRIVQISSDLSFRVLDAGTGKILAPPRQGVADPGDPVIVHNGRLIVRESSSNAQRLLAYDLEKTGEPRVLYTAPNNIQLSELTSCGADRVCWVEITGYAVESTRVASVNAAEGGGVWHLAVPNSDTLVPVGDHVLAAQNTTPPTMSLIDADGKQVWKVNGKAARLDGGNLLRFNKALSTLPDDPALYGEHLGDEAVPLGALSNVRSQTCSWNTSMIACVAGETFMLQRFAG